ncbi:hypothetical protein ACFYWO_01340 [Streptomyces sp. NPDC002932]|uniref:D-alanine--D-alanine ligase family protein n=1 Tax=Streptomyces sp. NPDC002932 TaxID=3364672 RepID=UPI003673C15C
MTDGGSQERDRSLASATAVMGALQDLGHSYTLIDLTADWETMAVVLGGCDVAFLAIAGGTQGGRLQGFLEAVGIPYTGSGVLASALGMNRMAARTIVRESILLTPRDYEVRSGERAADEAAIIADLFTGPVIVKQLAGGGSTCPALASTQGEVCDAITASTGAELMVEEYIKGVSVSVGVLDGAQGPAALSPLETEAPDELSTHEVTHTVGPAHYHCPARLPEDTLQSLRMLAELAHKGIRCSGYSQHHYVVDQAGAAHWLKVNTLPGLTRTGDMARMADADGISYTQLISHILATASAGLPAATMRSAA